MQRLYRMSRYFLPVMFFGYVPFANLAVYEEPGGKLAAFDMAALRGSVTHSFDTLYKTAMPHRDASIGVVGAARYLLIGEGRKGVVVGKDGWLFTNEETRPLPVSLQPSVAKIAEIRDQLATHGTKLIVLPLPAKVDVQSAEAASPELSAEMAGFYSDLLAKLNAAHVETVDARTPLLELVKSKPAFFATDTHWTLDGAAAVAAAIAKSGLIPLGTAEMTRTEEPKTEFAGDLVSYVTTEGIAPMLGLIREDANPYLVAGTADTSDIFAAPQVDVVLVGTSYSANPHWSFAEALKLDLHQDVLNAAEQGQGPVKPMDSYLASESLRDTPPKVVIWEIPLRYLTDPKLWDGHKVGQELASAD
ncbi:MAG: hypothetical protein JWS10_1540 [Cypionkella sp.]|uniref:alginate O-acetyltransferase AlgX-related protein n=1 Tax=Cypionkella sp. TaxID=2811411 RepID=UPI00262C2C83|nr:hypothetical protein [Cypionkella sp.]MDB5658925.1 hypothetical protein [Cypionkella sp.]